MPDSGVASKKILFVCLPPDVETELAIVLTFTLFAR